jgi:hypothetical protein
MKAPRTAAFAPTLPTNRNSRVATMETTMANPAGMPIPGGNSQWDAYGLDDQCPSSCASRTTWSKWPSWSRSRSTVSGWPL